MIIGISSPYRKAGLLWNKYNKHFGQDDDDVLVIKAPTPVPNPAIDQSFIGQALADDPISARAKMQLSKDSQLLSSGGTTDSISWGLPFPEPNGIAPAASAEPFNCRCCHG
jgi:hypothetical protein